MTFKEAVRRERRARIIALGLVYLVGFVVGASVALQAVTMGLIK